MAGFRHIHTGNRRKLSQGKYYSFPQFAAPRRLAGKGLLNERPHTSNDLEFLKAVCPGYSGEAFYQNQPAVTDGNLITASGIAPLEFSAQVFSRLEVFTPEIVDAWYQLYNTRNPKYYFRLMSEIQ
jgi:hypothetical protein